MSILSIMRDKLDAAVAAKAAANTPPPPYPASAPTIANPVGSTGGTGPASVGSGMATGMSNPVKTEVVLPPPAEIPKKQPWPTWKKAAVIGGGVLVVGTIVYLFMRKK